MTNGLSDSLDAISCGNAAGASAASMPRPRSRWIMRFALPLVIVLAAMAMLAYVASDVLIPAIEVEVVPVLTKAGATDGGSATGGDGAGREREPTVIAQAPGWIEPDPYAVTAQALIPGVVDDVLVLEGDRVQRGDVLVRLIAEDSELALRRAQAEAAELEAAVMQAEATLAAMEAKAFELQDEIDRKRDLVSTGIVPSGEFARLEHRWRSLQSEVDAARAALRQHEAAVVRQRVAVDEAELTLARTVIRSPIGGIVLARSVVPGTRITISGEGKGEAHLPGVMRLYDPARLQVRADVPLSDSAKVTHGTKARITTEAIPDRVFSGEVTRIMHQADIQRNTVQVKVRVDDPSPLLKPEMLVRVRFVGDGSAQLASRDDASWPDEIDRGSLRVYAPEAVLLNRDGDRAQVWIIEQGRLGRSRVAAIREVTLGSRDGDFIQIRHGLQAGDRLIAKPPPDLKAGSRVQLKSLTP